MPIQCLQRHVTVNSHSKRDRLTAWYMVSATEHREPLCHKHTPPTPLGGVYQDEILHHLITESRHKPRQSAFSIHAQTAQKTPPVSCTPLFSTYPLVWIVPADAPFLLSIRHLHFYSRSRLPNISRSPHVGSPSPVRSAAKIYTSLGCFTHEILPLSLIYKFSVRTVRKKKFHTLEMTTCNASD